MSFAKVIFLSNFPVLLVDTTTYADNAPIKLPYEYESQEKHFWLYRIIETRAVEFVVAVRYFCKFQMRVKMGLSLISHARLLQSLWEIKIHL